MNVFARHTSNKQHKICRAPRERGRAGHAARALRQPQQRRRAPGAAGGAAAAAAVGKIRHRTGGSAAADAIRLRSNSLSDHSPEKSKLRHPTAAVTSSSNLQPLNGEDEKLDKMMTFHQELSDTCVDILATYMFANVAVKPKRMPTAQFLLKNGQTASWVIGTKVVTITTSICDQTTVPYLTT